MKLNNKVAIVSGAAQGIGYSIAQLFSKEGAHVVVLDINDEKGSQVPNTIPNSEFIHCDMARSSDIKDAVNTVIANHKKIDICVNNAGILRSGDVLNITEQDFDDVIDVNLKGAFLLSQAAARHMVLARHGSIINMSSVNGITAIPNILPYNISKGGLDQLTRVMAIALASSGVRVNSIGPGSIMTELLEQVMTDDDKRRSILSRTPMGRCGTAEEVAKIALFLACQDSSYITGQIIYADGGRLALNYTVPVAD